MTLERNDPLAEVAALRQEVDSYASTLRAVEAKLRAVKARAEAAEARGDALSSALRSALAAWGSTPICDKCWASVHNNGTFRTIEQARAALTDAAPKETK